MEEERIDILSPLGTSAGFSTTKQEAHQKGWFHASAHVWLYTETGEILIQLRHTNKVNYPGLWDVSVAGHISAGESIVEGALREVEEEIGLTLNENDLRHLFIHKSEVTHAEDYIDNEFNHVFIAPLKVPLNRLNMQHEEVSAIKLLSIDTFRKELQHPIKRKLYVPHGASYYETIIKAIKINQ